MALHESPRQDPLVGVKVHVLRNGTNEVAAPITGADGIAHIDSLVADDYKLNLEGLPPHIVASSVPASVRFGVFFPKDLAYELPLDLVEGPLILFGDSDSVGKSDFRRTSIEDYLFDDVDLDAFFGWRFEARNRAEDSTPVAQVTQVPGYGLEQVRDGINEFPNMRFALLRFGLNDVAFYLELATDEAEEKFKDAYRDVLDLVVSRGITPILVTLQTQKDGLKDVGVAVANNIIRTLAEQYGAILVENDITWDHDRKTFYATNDPNGEHLNDAGTAHIAALVKARILEYYTVGGFAGGATAPSPSPTPIPSPGPGPGPGQ